MSGAQTLHGLRFIWLSVSQIYWLGLSFIDESIILLSIFIAPYARWGIRSASCERRTATKLCISQCDCSHLFDALILQTKTQARIEVTPVPFPNSGPLWDHTRKHDFSKQSWNLWQKHVSSAAVQQKSPQVKSDPIAYSISFILVFINFSSARISLWQIEDKK